MMLSAELLGAALAATHDGVVIAQLQGETATIVFANTAFLRLTGYCAAEVFGKDIYMSFTDQETEQHQQLKASIKDKKDCQMKLRLRSKEGRIYCAELYTSLVDLGDCTYIFSIYKDITQEEYIKSVLDKVNVLYREMSKRLEYTNETDHLTGLKNRSRLCTRGEFMLGAAKREKLRLHAILVDVDSFKMLNAVGGNNWGDECLIKISDVIRRYFSRATDIAVRMCDDEFVVICIEDDDQRVRDRVESLRNEVRALKIEDDSGRIHDISISIGIYSVNPEKHTTIEDMIHNAGQLVFRFSSAGQIIHSAPGSSQLSNQ